MAIRAQNIEAHVRALGMLVHERGDPERYPTVEENDAMLAHWRAIVADPRMQEISFYGDAERWFLQLLIGTAPFTDVLVLPVTDHFGWLEMEGKVRETPALDAVVHRYRMLSFLERVQQPEHELYAAWRELSAPADCKSRRGKVKAGEIDLLIRGVRTRYPELEGCWDPYRIAMWRPNEVETGSDYAPTRGWRTIGTGGWIAIVWLLIIVAGIFARNEGRPASDQPPAVSLTDSNYAVVGDQMRDIGMVLSEFGDGKLTWPQVQAGNPALAEMLRANWEKARDRRDVRNVFLADMRPLVEDWYRDGLRTADYPILAEHRRISLDKAKALRALDVGMCDGFFRGASVPASMLPGDFDARSRTFASKALLAIKAEPRPEAPGNGRFTIDGAVFDKAAKRAGLSPARFGDAMLGKGTPGERCNGRIALIEVALELPSAKGLKLLRDM